MNKIRAGIIGGAGYTGGELLRLLLLHPAVEVVFVHSRSHAGAYVHEVHTDLFGDTDLKFVDSPVPADVVFLCLGHGESKKALAGYGFSAGTKVIDLSQDFRLQSPEGFDFIYGLPEINREKISSASHIANPGCFATAIQLGLLPLAEKGLLPEEIHVSCTTGSTGAGQSLSESSHFSWRQNNLSVYKAFTHQHLQEINKNLSGIQPAFGGRIFMLPQRGAFTRGILACIQLPLALGYEEITAIYNNYYHSHPFVWITAKNPDLKQVVNTNKCFLFLEKNNDQLLVVSVIDNLLKGASGQAVQNMNLMFGLEESAGLKLKASAF